MLGRLASLQIASRRDVVLFVIATLLLLAFTMVWAVFLTPIINDQVLNKYFLTLVILIAAAVPALIPRFLPGWGGTERRPWAAFMVRFGMALLIFGVLITPIGLFYATDTQRSVPVAFASFTAVLLGIFVAGFGGNMLAPPRA